MVCGILSIVFTMLVTRIFFVVCSVFFTCVFFPVFADSFSLSAFPTDTSYDAAHTLVSQGDTKTVHFYSNIFNEGKLELSDSEEGHSQVGETIQNIFKGLFQLLFAISGTAMVLFIAVHGVYLIYSKNVIGDYVKYGHSMSKLRGAAIGSALLLLSWVILHFVSPSLLNPVFFQHIKNIRNLNYSNVYKDWIQVPSGAVFNKQQGVITIPGCPVVNEEKLKAFLVKEHGDTVTVPSNRTYSYLFLHKDAESGAESECDGAVVTYPHIGLSNKIIIVPKVTVSSDLLSETLYGTPVEALVNNCKKQGEYYFPDLPGIFSKCYYLYNLFDFLVEETRRPFEEVRSSVDGSLSITIPTNPLIVPDAIGFDREDAIWIESKIRKRYYTISDSSGTQLAVLQSGGSYDVSPNTPFVVRPCVDFLYDVEGFQAKEVKVCGRGRTYTLEN